ncbi:MAG TPA: J domain-containing protein [Vicinamibacterales bacterium]|nr:J domain-containing protein [Vicinamibacterales bacterium]
MDFRDYYATLGVPKTATAKDIKQAFRRLARKHHPDVNPGDRGAEAKFKELNEAYEVLGNPDTRRKYDELGANWRQYEQAGPGAGGPFGSQPQGANYRTMTPEEMEHMFGAGGSPFSDFFNTFFGGQGQHPPRGRTAGRGRTRRQPRVEYEIPLELQETLGGHVERVVLQESGGPRTLEVRIPAGVTDGTGLTAGDVLLRVRLLPHPRFERTGRDLRTALAVPVTTAVLGGTAEVVTLSGAKLSVKVPPGTQAGQKLRLRGHGLPAPGAPDDRGDLYVTVDVRLPTTLSTEAKTHYEALRALETSQS